MYIEAVPNRNSPARHPAARELSRRRQGVVQAHAAQPFRLAHRSHRRPARRAQGRHRHPRRARTPSPSIRSLPHGRRRGPRHGAQDRPRPHPRSAPERANRCRDLVLAMMVSRILDPASKLAAARALVPPPPHPASAKCSASARSTRTNSTPRSTGCWSARPRSRRHWPSAISSTARWCSTTSRRATWKAAAARWPSAATAATASKGTLQIVYGLLCAPDGCPVAIEVFEGNTADPMTFATQIEKLKQRFRLDHVVLVGDRGMITAGAHHRGHQARPASTGSPRCAHRRSRRCSTAAPCSSRCSISATWPPSPPGLPRRAADGLPQSRSRRRAHPQARRPAAGDRARSRPHPGRRRRASAIHCAAPPRSRWRSAR